MRKRNKVDLPLIWVHIDMLHPGISSLLAAASTRHGVALKGETVFSVNVSRDGTEALIKIAGVNKSWAKGLGSSPLVKAVFDGADHHLAVAIVNAPGWAPLPE